MYTTISTPWQSSGYALPQQFMSQSFMPFSPTGNIQSGFIPQGAVSYYGFNPNWAWQPFSPVGIGSQFASFIPQAQSQMINMNNPSAGIRATAGFAQPRVEVAETNTDVIVTADLPNVDPNNIYITATDDSLSISALSYMGGIAGSLHRTVALPTNVRSEHIDVSYTNGMLECRLPKSDLSARRRVKVNAAV